MSSQATPPMTSQSPPPSDPDDIDTYNSQLYDEALERLTKYYITADRCMARVQRTYTTDQMKSEFSERYKEALATFHADPVKNPVNQPTTVQEMREFVKKCDDCCLGDLDAMPIDECIRVLCAVNYGAQFLTGHLSYNHNISQITKLANERCLEQYHPDEVARMHTQLQERSLDACEKIILGQRVRMRTPDGGEVREYRLVDQGSSAMKGQFWTYEEVGVDNPKSLELAADEFDDRFVEAIERSGEDDEWYDY